LGIGEEVVSLIRRILARRDHRAGSTTPVHDVEQDVRRSNRHLSDAEVIDHEQVRLAKLRLQLGDRAV
jgi:hypothetical protein